MNMAGSRKSSHDYLELRRRCNDLLRAGKGRQVTLALADLDVEAIPKSERLPLAAIAKRAHLFALGLKILAPLMLQFEASGKPDPEVLAEHGFLLHKIGSTSEAMRIFELVDAKAVPDVLFYKAFCHFSRWEYSEALTALEVYVGQNQVAPYQRLVGKVNLASARIVAHDESASRTLEEVLSECRAGAHARLTANCLELGAQIAIRERRFAAAEEMLTESLGLLETDSTSDRLFAEKWRAVVIAERDGEVEPLIRVRASAKEHGHWETAREADRTIAKITGDEKLFNKLYFGSPFESYRRILTTNTNYRPPETFVIGEGGKVLDVATGLLDGESLTKPAQAIHRLIAGLLSDFYRPFKLGGLFAALFPNERFDVFHSPNRVYQAIHRAREFFAEKKIPFIIEEKDGFFRLTRTGELRMLLRNEARRPVSAESVQLLRLMEAMPGQEFATREAIAALGISETGAKRVLRYGLATGALVRVGSGIYTRYRRAA